MRIIIVLLFFAIYTFLFKKAAGTLNLKKINLTGLTYYVSLVFGFIGGSIVFCGFRNHYLIGKVSDDMVDKTFFILMWTLIAFPATICLVNKVFQKRKMYDVNNVKIEEKCIEVSNSRLVWLLCAFLTVVCALGTVYVLKCIGYFPLLEMFRMEDSELAINRMVSTRGFAGDTYVRNIIMLGITPILSYVVYIYMRITKLMKWRVLFLTLFGLSIIAKTYNFEKGPVVMYVLFFYVVEVLLGNIKKLGSLFVFGGIGSGIIIMMYYVVMGYNGNFFSLSSGPVSRILVTQVATLFLHVQAFPKYSPFLDGKSLPTVLAKLVGLEESWVRSGRVVMEIYNPVGIKAGTAGVMNTLFVGEAYANWGTTGVILAPILVGVMYAVVTIFYMKQRKTPLLLAGYMVFVINFTQAFIGGFVDYLYSFSIIFLICLIMGIVLLKNRGILRYRR